MYLLICFYDVYTKASTILFFFLLKTSKMYDLDNTFHFYSIFVKETFSFMRSEAKGWKE